MKKSDHTTQKALKVQKLLGQAARRALDAQKCLRCFIGSRIPLKPYGGCTNCTYTFRARKTCEPDTRATSGAVTSLETRGCPSKLLARRPDKDPLEAIMFVTSVGVPSSLYETVRTLRQARAGRLGSMQRKVRRGGRGAKRRGRAKRGHRAQRGCVAE